MKSIRYVFTSVLIFINSHKVNAGDIVWDTSPKIQSFIVLNFYTIRRLIKKNDFSLVKEINYQLGCSDDLINRNNIILLINQKLTATQFSVQLLNELSC